MYPLDPAPVSVVDEPYKKALDQYNRETEEAMMAAHTKKLAAAPVWRRALRCIRRNICSCIRPSAEEIPPVYTPLNYLPPNVYVGHKGELIRTGSPVYDVKAERRPPYRLM